MKEWFRRFSGVASDAAGSWQAFLLAALIVAVWFAAGFFVGFENTFYQLLINTGTTIITFLMVFLIQNTQNRDAKAIHLKLDELLRAVEGARTSMANLENLPDEELKRLQEEFRRICETRGFGARAVEAIEDVMEEREASRRGAAK
ncbi:MAG: low affinity iron permease family protein [Acidobacteria bacterium]|nr:MAG: low affinity iron permease family protein [Acidobacteriota bacterium]PYS84163.1 MAG: low affinity iron permease family protein [Acidobacteriota bacterium]